MDSKKENFINIRKGLRFAIGLVPLSATATARSLYSPLLNALSHHINFNFADMSLISRHHTKMWTLSQNPMTVPKSNKVICHLMSLYFHTWRHNLKNVWTCLLNKMSIYYILVTDFQTKKITTLQRYCFNLDAMHSLYFNFCLSVLDYIGHVK